MFARVTYLNAGTCGPLPLAARRAAADVVDLAEADGRRAAYYERLGALRDRQREGYAAVLGAASPGDVAITTSTSEGVGRVVAGLDLKPGDEILTSEWEHPGLLGPLLAAQQRRGVQLRTAPLADLPDAVGPQTKLVACSHVGWVTGDVAPSFAGVDAPVLLDGAQGIGAIAFDVRELGCDFYAGSGQKWLCGPVGTGMLWIAPQWQERLGLVSPAYASYARTDDPLDAAALHPDARRFDLPAQSAESAAAATASLDVLGGFGWPNVYARARELAALLARRLADAGHRVAPRGETTLVAWEDADPVTTRDRLALEGIAVRDLPATSYLRASVGAWNDEGDLDRLVSALARTPA